MTKEQCEERRRGQDGVVIMIIIIKRIKVEKEKLTKWAKQCLAN